MDRRGFFRGVLGAAAAALVGIGEWADYSPIGGIHKMADLRIPVAENAAAYGRRLPIFEELNGYLADIGDRIVALEA